jgi:hypothetical protein
MPARPPMPAPQLLESPAVRRSAMLAKLLEEQRKPVDIRGGYGELGARLLAQGITQWGANRAERAVQEEGQQRLAGQTEAANLALARLLGGEPPASADAPMAPPLTNTQEPVEAQIAPVAPVAGSSMPAAAPAGVPAAPMPMADVPPMQPAPQAAPQPASAPRNALGITPGEADLVRRALSSGDAGQIAWAQGVLGEIEGRMSAPPEWKDVSVNGVPYLRDQFGNMREAFEGGLPQSAMAQNATVGEDNPYGVAGGTGISLDPYNRPQIIGRPPEGFSREAGGGLAPERGGPQDLNNPTRRFAELTNLRKEIDPVIDSATLLQRNIQALRAGSRAQNGAGDIAMINGLQKLIDEGVVREGDVALQLQAQGINGGIAGLQGYLTSSGRFSPAIRAQLLATGEDIYRNMNSVYRDRVLSYEPLVTSSFGAGAFDDVLPARTRDAFGWGGGAPAPQAPRQQPRTPRPAAPNRPRPASDNNDPLGLR